MEKKLGRLFCRDFLVLTLQGILGYFQSAALSASLPAVPTYFNLCLFVDRESLPFACASPSSACWVFLQTLTQFSLTVLPAVLPALQELFPFYGSVLLDITTSIT